MAYYDPAATVKKKPKVGPDGKPVMEVDAIPKPGFRGFNPTGPMAPIVTAAAAPPPRMQADLPPPVAGGVPPSRMGAMNLAANAPMGIDAPPPVAKPLAGGLTPLPFNDRKAAQRASGDYARALHSDSQGLSPMDREARIGMIRDREDVRDAYSRANAPVQRVQQPGEQVGRYNELRGQMFGQFNKELEDLTAQRAALDREPLSDETLQRRATTDAAIAAKRAQIEKAVGNWGDLTPEQAAGRTAGQERLSTRQQADRASGAADVAAYQNREKYGRSQMDEIRQVEFDRQRAAVGAETAGYGAQTAAANAIQQSGGLTPEQQVAQIQANQMKAAITGAASGQANPYTAQRAVEQRSAAFATLGLDGDNYNRFLDRALGDLTALTERTSGVQADGDVGNIVASLNEATMPVLDQLASLDPEAAASVARDLLSKIPANPQQSGGSQFLTGMAGALVPGAAGAFGGTQKVAAGALGQLRQKLQGYAGVRPSP